MSLLTGISGAFIRGSLDTATEGLRAPAENLEKQLAQIAGGKKRANLNKSQKHRYDYTLELIQEEKSRKRRALGDRDLHEMIESKFNVYLDRERNLKAAKEREKILSVLNISPHNQID